MVRPDFHHNHFHVVHRSMECYEYREMPTPNHKGKRISGGSHGDDMVFDGACLTGPQPYTGEETRVPPVCCRFPLSAGWNLERHTRRKSDGRIPRPSGRGGGQCLLVTDRCRCQQIQYCRLVGLESVQSRTWDAASGTPSAVSVAMSKQTALSLRSLGG